MNLTTLYEDEYCLVLDKPAGLAVQGGAGVRVSLDAILAARDGNLLLVHRLDKETSGVILVARGARAAHYFATTFSQRTAHKHYCAVTNGGTAQEAGQWRDVLLVDGTPKEALTTYRRVSRRVEGDDCWTRFSLELGTGRTHQLRRVLATHGCPVLGDDKYGDFALNHRLRKERGLRRMLLHAAHLEALLPTGETLTVDAPLPDYFAPYI
jgi:23S rRNA pseudouridine955/2504/2580 synthase